jgi:squalene-associated FAD-dependent desaturase
VADPERGGYGETRVAVIGGGWAGCAAAVTLANAGIAVSLFEQARTLGGRARRVTLDDVTVDNGQHLLVGAYRQTLGLLSTVHGADRVPGLLRRFPLTIRPFGSPTSGSLELTAWRVPAPFHLVTGILAARGLRFAERVAMVSDARRLGRLDMPESPDDTVLRRYARAPDRAFASFWAPLCLAALNTPPEAASARIYASVLAATLRGPRRNSDFLVPAVDLSALFPDAAARFVGSRGGTIHMASGVRAVAPTPGGVVIDTGTAAERFAAAIVAVGPHQLAATVGAVPPRDPVWGAPLARVAAFSYESITTIYLGFAGRVRFPAPVTRLDDAPGQWVFDRSAIAGRARPSDFEALAAVVISAGGPHDDLDHNTLARDVEAQLRRLSPGLPAVAWARVIAERRATYACTSALARPPSGRIAPGLYLAGDYTDPYFPPTLEAATRSGVAAAVGLIEDRSR